MKDFNAFGAPQMSSLDRVPRTGTPIWVNGAEGDIEGSGDAVIAKIESFASLPRGWHYGSGGPIGNDIRRKAIQWVDTLRHNGFFDLEAFPNENGEILIASIAGRYYIEVIVETDDTITIVYDIDGKQQMYMSRKTAHEAERAIKELSERIWNTSAGFTLLKFTRSSTDITAWRSSHREMEVYLLSNSPALATPVEMYANMQSGIRPMWERLPYFGNLPPQSCHWVTA